jgi:hypothetical protein
MNPRTTVRINKFLYVLYNVHTVDRGFLGAHYRVNRHSSTFWAKPAFIRYLFFKIIILFCVINTIVTMLRLFSSSRHFFRQSRTNRRRHRRHQKLQHVKRNIIVRKIREIFYYYIQTLRCRCAENQQQKSTN